VDNISAFQDFSNVKVFSGKYASGMFFSSGFSAKALVIRTRININITDPRYFLIFIRSGDEGNFVFGKLF
jgi:hypothetical protein